MRVGVTLTLTLSLSLTPPLPLPLPREQALAALTSPYLPCISLESPSYLPHISLISPLYLRQALAALTHFSEEPLYIHRVYRSGQGQG